MRNSIETAVIVAVMARRGLGRRDGLAGAMLGVGSMADGEGRTGRLDARGGQKGRQMGGGYQGSREGDCKRGGVDETDPAALPFFFVYASRWRASDQRDKIDIQESTSVSGAEHSTRTNTHTHMVI